MSIIKLLSMEKLPPMQIVWVIWYGVGYDFGEGKGMVITAVGIIPEKDEDRMGGRSFEAFLMVSTGRNFAQLEKFLQENLYQYDSSAF